MNKKPKRELLVFDTSRDGHRRDYFRVLRRALGGHAACGRPRDWLMMLIKTEKVLFSTYDDYFLTYTALALVRSMLARPTVGIAVRAETIFHGMNLNRLLKRILLKALRHLPHVHTLTLMPYWAEPRLAAYTSDWMYELQFWDLDWLHLKAGGAALFLRDTLHQAARGRTMVGSIGHQRRVKGVEYFMALYEQPRIREQYLFVCVGPKWDVDTARVQRFRDAGGLFLNVRLRDDDMVPIYHLFDVIWACYRPDYNQSSGIFGRALQLGRPTIVRTGSYLARLQRGLGGAGYQIPYSSIGEAAAILVPPPLTWEAEFHVAPDRSYDLLRRLLQLSPRQRQPNRNTVL